MQSFLFKSVFAAFLATALFFGGELSFQTASAAANDHRSLADIGPNDRLVSQFVWQMMERNHLSRHGVDDEISQRAFDKYIKSLDPSKTWFRQSDINEFSKWKTKFDDQLKASDYTAAFEIFDRFVQRVDQQTELAIGFVDANQDFTVIEEMKIDPDQATWAKDDAEAREIWRKRVKYNLLVLRGDSEEKSDAPKTDPKDILKKRYLAFARRVHQFDNEDVIERFITSITSSFDPHSNYMSHKSFDNFMIQMNLELDGIGASLQETDEGYTVIKSLVEGGAAAVQGGLKLEDKIVAVAQGDENGNFADAKLAGEFGTDFVDTAGMGINDVIDMIRGKAGTVLRLSVISEDQSGLHTVSLRREKIRLEDQAARGAVFEDGTKADGSPKRIGVLELPMFYAGMGGGDSVGRSSTTDVRRILDDFNAKHVDALILDLRNNGGGSLKEAIDCTGLFIDVGPVVQVRDSYGQIEVLDDTTRGVAWSKPMIVLTSKLSASASEILAGAIQDYHRGLVVGDSSTHGKGTVQSMLNIGQMVSGNRLAASDFGALKITIQQFYRPDGDSTQLRGVLSDIVLPSVTDKLDIGESDLEYPVDFDRIPMAKYETCSMTNPKMISQLGEQSEARRNSSSDFQKLVASITRYVKYKDNKTVSLNEERFLARRKDLSAEREAEDAIVTSMKPNEIKRDFYLDEVLRIASDYMDVLSGNRNAVRITAIGQSQAPGGG